MKRISCLKLGALVAIASGQAGCGPATMTVDATDYRPPAAVADGTADDRPSDPGPPFDAGLASPLPVGDWRVNLSAAVVRLDVPPIHPDTEPSLSVLHPSYTSATTRPNPAGRAVLPSIDLIDGKAKQFDDGFRAAIELAHYRGLGNPPAGQIALIRRFLAAVGGEGPAAPFLAAGLDLAGEAAAIAPGLEGDKASWLKEFRADELRSKPVGHATWSPDLAAAFRFSRFFSRTFDRNEPAIPLALAGALDRDPGLRADYGRSLGLLARLTNPSRLGPIGDRTGRPVALFPPPTSREAELFDRLFPSGPPPGADLMGELVARVRSGEVKLDPRPAGGWYDHQVYALETLLLPAKADEHAKLLLTRSYKRRRLDAFMALMTKRRETHEIEVKSTIAVKPLDPISPRLRVEPCPSYFLRTARSYGFLAEAMDEAIGPEALRSLHGLRDGGLARPLDLRSELDSMRALFFGLALISSEDLGLECPCLDAEGLDADACRRAALDWLAHPEADPDLAVDTRVCTPILASPGGGTTRTWATLGVRLAKLDATFARPPRVRPASGEGDWSDVPPHLLAPAEYLIAVDEFAEFDLKGLRALDRAEFRRICDAGKARAAILARLGR